MPENVVECGVCGKWFWDDDAYESGLDYTCTPCKQWHQDRSNG